jgi:MOSC domain-containing protein YiiM
LFHDDRLWFDADMTVSPEPAAAVSVSQVVSVNVGLPREVVWRGETVETSIFKEPVTGRVAVRALNLDGDRQADLSVHGGPDKAVYVYPAEHYGYWRSTLAHDVPWGMFGENLTVEGLPLEDAIAIGDRLRIGSAEFTVVQPRLPCFKLGIRFGDPLMVRKFLQSGRSGYYLRVTAAGELGVGDEIAVFDRHPGRVSVAEVTRVFTRARDDVDALHRLLAVDALPEGWRSFFEGSLADAVG